MKTRTPRAGAAKGPKRRASRPAAPTRTPERAAPPVETVETAGRRMHGDSYSDVVSHEDEVVGSSFASLEPDRRQEEPSEPALGAPERLEGGT